MKRLTPLTQDEPKVDHNILHLCAQGFWWCDGCSKVTNLVYLKDAIDLEDYGACCHCNSRNVHWNAPVFVDEHRQAGGAR